MKKLLIVLLTPLAVLSVALSGCLQNSITVVAKSSPTKAHKQAATVSEFELIDRHALNAPEHVEQSLQTLAAYLIKPAKNDREKARAIYRWITHNIAYDDEGFFSSWIIAMNIHRWLSMDIIFHLSV